MHQPNEQLPKIRDFDGHDWFLTQIYRRNLPHWELKGSTYFVTFRVVPEVKRPFRNPIIARYMTSFLWQDKGETHDLQAYVVMPDHIHLIIKPLGEKSLSQIMQKMKGATSYAINKMLNRTGKFWQAENFDRLIRDSLELRQKWEYVKANPVKANIVTKSQEYPYSSFFIPE